jgi:hypothetical protein
MSEISDIKMHFHQNLEDGLAGIKLDFEADCSELNEQEYEQLCISYLAMLESGNEDYYYDTRFLTQVEQESLMMRMSKGLYRQYVKDSTCRMVALAIQLKYDFDNSENYRQMFLIH